MGGSLVGNDGVAADAMRLCADAPNAFPFSPNVSSLCFPAQS